MGCTICKSEVATITRCGVYLYKEGQLYLYLKMSHLTHVVNTFGSPRKPSFTRESSVQQSSPMRDISYTLNLVVLQAV